MVAVDGRPITVEDPHWLQDATITVRAIDALRNVGAIDALLAGPCSTTRLVEELAVEREVLELALDVARFAGLVRWTDGAWMLPEPSAVRMVLEADAVTGALAGVQPEVDAADVLRSGEIYADRVERIGAFTSPHRDALVRRLTRPGQHVLELGAGASPWGRALCAADESTTVTAIDLPPVLPTTRRVVSDDGFASRYTFVAADVFDPAAGVDFAPADLIVVAGLCRLVGAERNATLFRAASTWSRPAARIAVIDAVATPDARAAGLSRYELGLRTRTSEGRCWSLDHYARWLTSAGFGGVDLVTTRRAELSLVLATKGPPT